MSGSVSSATSLAKVAAATAAATAPAAKRAVTNAGLMGYGAGAAGLLLTLLNTWKDSIDKKDAAGAGGLFGNAGMSIGIGAVLLTIAESGKLGGLQTTRNLRGGGLALISVGALGAIAGTATRFTGIGGDSQPREAEDNRLQRPKNFTTDVPAAPASLTDMAVGWGEAKTKDGKPADLAIYVDPDPRTAKQLPSGTTLGTAIGNAHASTQTDKLHRSHAVIKTKDGSFWTVPLTGELDQVDGPYYDKDNRLDPSKLPIIGKQQAALQAIVGADSVYVFPAGVGAKEAPQNPGNVPWITPDVVSTSTTEVTKP